MNLSVPYLSHQEDINTNKSKTIYHYVFRIYKGIFALVDLDAKDFLAELFRNIAEDKGFVILKYNILADHVHLLIEQDNSDSERYIIKSIKGISARKFFEKYKTNRFVYRKLWGRGYFSREIDTVDVDSVVKYIDGQVDKNGIDKRFS